MAAGAAVCHIAAVTKLDGGLRALSMDGIGEFFQVGDDFFAHPELPVERNTAAIDGCIGNSGHANAALSYGGMVVEQILRGLVVVAHVFKGCGADGTVAEGERTECDRGENLGF